MKRRQIHAAIAALALGAACGTPQAQTVGRIISGYPAGGAIDQLARVFAEEIGKGMGKTYIVETRAGAGGQIAADTLKAATPDGNTLMIAAASNMTVYPHTVRKPSYELKDFVPVAIAGEYDTGLAVKLDPLAGDFKGFLAQAKANVVMASYATPGAGSMPHFYGMLLSQATGLPFKHIPYRGTGPAINDVVAGHVGSVLSPVGTLVPQAKAGNIRMVATTGTRRSRQMPDVPTFRELGYPQLEASTWFGLFVPAGTPPQVVARLNEIAVKAVQTPAVRDRLLALDVEPREMSQAEFASRVRAESEQWGKVVKASGFVADGQ
jgi:tripartite-type tricarboxylate transporter receptor subunit TctC